MKEETELKEWMFQFGLSHKEGKKIVENDANALMNLIVEWAEENDFCIGGGYGED